MLPSRSDATVVRVERYGPLLIAAFAFLLLIAFSTRVTSEAITLRSALLLLVLPLSPLVLRRAWSLQPVATSCAFGFVVVAGLSAASSESWLSVFGHYDWNTGFLFVVALVTCWALGVTASERARALIVGALVAGFVVNSAVAVLQMRADLAGIGLPRFEGRASGLLGNPVHLAALAAGAFAMSAWNVVHRHALWCAAAAAAVVTTQISGSRLGLIVVVAGTVGVAVRYRSLRTVVLVAAVVAGLVAGEVAPATTGGPTGVGRAVTAGGDPHARVEGWKTAATALGDNVLFGAGPGRFQAGIAPYRTLALAQASPDSSYVDAHNPVVEYAVTTGGLGVLLLAAWMIAALAGARLNPLLWFAVGVLALHLAQPQHVGTTPLALLALGASSRRRAPRSSATTRWYAVAGLLLAPPALYGAARLVSGDARLATATATRSPEMAVEADDLLPAWPQPARRVAQLYLDRADRQHDDAFRVAAVEWLETAAERDPTRAFWWFLLAEQEAELGHDKASRAHYSRALEADPYSPRALRGLADLEREDGHVEAALALLRRALEVSPDPAIARTIEEYSGRSR